MRSGLAERDGFTLIEILIVIIIVGILAAIAIPMYVAQRDKAKGAALKLNARNVKITAHSYVADSLNTTWTTSAATTNGKLSTYAAKYVSCALEENIKMGGADRHQRRRLPEPLLRQDPDPQSGRPADGDQRAAGAVDNAAEQHDLPLRQLPDQRHDEGRPRRQRGRVLEHDNEARSRSSRSTRTARSPPPATTCRCDHGATERADQVTPSRRSPSPRSSTWPQARRATSTCGSPCRTTAA